MPNLYEITAAGFDASTDLTDNRVYWVAAETDAEIEQVCAGTDAKWTCMREGPLRVADWYNVDFRLPEYSGRLRYVLQGWQRIAKPAAVEGRA